MKKLLVVSGLLSLSFNALADETSTGVTSTKQLQQYPVAPVTCQQKAIFCFKLKTS